MHSAPRDPPSIFDGLGYHRELDCRLPSSLAAILTTTTAPTACAMALQGAQRVVAAALYEHPVGTELRVYFEPEDRDDVLQSYVERIDRGRARGTSRDVGGHAPRERMVAAEG
jgi:hypothetical protein